MVEQMIDPKQIDRSLISPGASLLTCGKQLLTEVKKTALRDLQNDNRMLTPQDVPNGGLVTDGRKASGTKRPTPESTMGPPCHQPPSSNVTNGNLVYIRRKSEHEVEKNHTIDNIDKNAGCPQPRQFRHGMQEASPQQIPLQGPKSYNIFKPMPGVSVKTYSTAGPSLPPSRGKPVNGMQPKDVNNTVVTSGAVNSQKKKEQDFNERFLRLQANLKSFDNSSNEEYIQMLRDLPSVGRSRHAVELEKRAIQLLLEEKKELERMRILNVLGKSIPKESALPSTIPALSGK